MTWFIIVIAAVGIYLFMFMLKSGNAVPLAVSAQELGTEGRIEAIEYFWRPG